MPALTQDILSTTDKALFATLSKLEELNGRLELILDAADLLTAIHLVATDPGANIMLLQPKPTNYCWSDRTIVAVLVAKTGDHVRVRMRRARSYHGAAVSASIWQELKAFPKGDAGGKLTRWAATAEGSWIPIAVARSCPKRELSCQCQEWKIEWTPQTGRD